MPTPHGDRYCPGVWAVTLLMNELKKPDLLILNDFGMPRWIPRVAVT